MHINSRTDKVNESAVISRRDYGVWRKAYCEAFCSDTTNTMHGTSTHQRLLDMHYMQYNLLHSNFLLHWTIFYSFANSKLFK